MNGTLSTLAERIRSRCVPDAGCLVWTGAVASGRYGAIRLPGTRRVVYVHRIVWQAAYGELPDRYEIDHVCENTLCCNLAHLSARSSQEHRERHLGTATGCRAGHPWTPESTYWYRGSRYCRICRARHQRKYKYRSQVANAG